MIKYRVPASSANIGVGFDTLGLALNIYNYNEIEESAEFILEGFLNEILEDNMFYQTYKKVCEHFNDDVRPLWVKLNSEIPVSRGLGSSSAIIVGAIYAYYLINDLEIDKEQIQKLATEIEGHPDNVTPCIYGGLCASCNELVSHYEISNKWQMYALIPPYEVETSAARKVIKQEVSLKDAVKNVSSALIGIDGLVCFDEKKVGLLNNDSFHEPYRKDLIKDYDRCKEIALKQGASAFLISGSGSTMLVISKYDLNLCIEGIEIRKVKVDQKGVVCLRSY